MEELESLMGDLGELTLVKDRVRFSLFRQGCEYMVTFPQLDTFKGRISEGEIFRAIKNFDMECKGVGEDPGFFEAISVMNMQDLMHNIHIALFQSMDIMQYLALVISNSAINHITVKVDGRIYAFFGDGNPFKEKN